MKKATQLLVYNRLPHFSTLKAEGLKGSKTNSYGERIARPDILSQTTFSYEVDAT